jgi:hypothetical protein
VSSLSFLAGVSTRLRAIICSGLGADGSLGSAAQARSIPSGRFLDGAAQPSFRSTSYPPDRIDRAVKLRWRGAVANPIPANPRDGKSIRIVRVTIDVAYVSAHGLEQRLRPIAGETQDEAIEVGSRGISDAERIDAAVTWSELYGASPATDPPICLIYRDGETTIEELGPIYVASSPYRLHLDKNQGQTYDPVP